MRALEYEAIGLKMDAGTATPDEVDDAAKHERSELRSLASRLLTDTRRRAKTLAMFPDRPDTGLYARYRDQSMDQFDEIHMKLVVVGDEGVGQDGVSMQTDYYVDPE